MGAEAASPELQETEMGNWGVVLSLEWTLVCLKLCPEDVDVCTYYFARCMEYPP